VGVAVTFGLDETMGLGLGGELALGLAETLAVRLAEMLAVRLAEMLAIALLALSHPATMHPIARIAAKKTRPLVRRCMPDPSARPFCKAGCSGRPRTNDPAYRAT
jgi:multisubunit Na+/H+ antiporter MnhG subunit